MHTTWENVNRHFLQKKTCNIFLSDASDVGILYNGSDTDSDEDNSYDISIISDNVLSDFDSCCHRR